MVVDEEVPEVAVVVHEEAPEVAVIVDEEVSEVAVVVHGLVTGVWMWLTCVVAVIEPLEIFLFPSFSLIETNNRNNIQ